MKRGMYVSKLKSLFIRRADEKNSFKSDLLVLLIYTAGIIFVTCFHELWFDETQAWQIAKCASFKELFTYIPHYEGHPPMWHLFLSIFAKNGAPVDFTLKAINTVFCVIAMALLIFRSPFPRIVRYLLPFTFYFFYQYGVLSRPYSISMIAFFLMAIAYKDRNAHPWRYILAMTLLSLSTAFGLMIAGGLCIVWTFEIIAELIRNKKLKFFWKDMRFWSLCFILVIAVAVMLMIIPADNCYYIGADDGLSVFDRVIFLPFYEYLAAMPFESWSGILLGNYDINSIPAIGIVEIICGLAMWVGLSAFAVKNKKFFTFFLPYLIVTVVWAFKYVSIHHLGLGALLHIFLFWIMAEQEGGIAVPEFMKKLNSKVTSPSIRKFVIVAGSLICLAPVAYSVIASVLDMTHEVGLTCVADIIKENHLEDTNIMAMWDVKYEGDDDDDDDDEKIDRYLFATLEIPSAHRPIKESRTYLSGASAMIQPYFDKNIIMNFNADCPEDMYMHYQYKEDSEKIYSLWREKGLPDFIVGYCPIDDVYDEKTLEGVRYLPVKMIDYCTVGKVCVNHSCIYFYMRDDLFDEYPQFEWINDQTGNVFERKPQKAE